MSGSDNRPSARVRCANGWTISIVPEFGRTCFSLIAWPSKNDDKVVDNLRDDDWFKFEPDRQEIRCWSMEDIVSALAQVAAAPPP